MGRLRKKNQPGGGCLALFGIPFAIAGIVLVWFYFAGYTNWLKARFWVEVPCWIETTELKTNRGESDTYQALATYRYEYEGRTYHGDRVSFGTGSDNIGSFHEDAHRELSSYLPDQGEVRPFRCYVNPARPEESIIYRTIRWQMQAFFAVFVLTFPPVGVALVAGGLMGGRSLRREAALRAANPQEPWKWKTGWSGESIPEAISVWRIVGLLYTVWSGLMILPLILTCLASGAFVSDSSAWWVLVFPALWLLPAWWCWRIFRRWLAVGEVRFQQTEIPARTGHLLSGAVLLKKPLASRLDAKVELICEKKITRDSGDGTSTTTERVWSAEKVVPQDQMIRDISGFRLPVAFQLPVDAPAWEMDSQVTEAHQWILKLTVPGSPVTARFEVPVFEGDGKATSPQPAVQPISVAKQASEDLPAHLASRGIKAEFDGDGLPLSIVSPPGRRRMAWLTMAFFNLIWSAVAVFLVQSDAPMAFKIVWPVTASGLWMLVVWMAFHGREVKVDENGIFVLNRLGPFSRSVRLERSRVIGFTHDSNMTSNDTRYYRVRLEDVMGRKVTLADGLVSSTCAAELATRFQHWKSGR